MSGQNIRMQGSVSSSIMFHQFHALPEGPEMEFKINYRGRPARKSSVPASCLNVGDILSPTLIEIPPSRMHGSSKGLRFS